MSLLEQQNTLARLLTDTSFREDFLADPILNGAAIGLNESETNELVQMAELDLTGFADSLVWKRLREVEKILPLTSRIAGESFRTLFFEFAPTFNPRSIKKHFQDAVQFCRFIEERGGDDAIVDAARFERTRLVFLNREHLVAFCRFRYLFTQSGDNAGPTRRGRTAVSVWLRLGKKRVFHFVI